MNYYKVAEAAGFDVLLTTDKRIRYQQILVLKNSTWPVVRRCLDRIATAVNNATPGSYTEIYIPFQ